MPSLIHSSLLPQLNNMIISNKYFIHIAHHPISIYSFCLKPLHIIYLSLGCCCLNHERRPLAAWRRGRSADVVGRSAMAKTKIKKPFFFFLLLFSLADVVWPLSKRDAHGHAHRKTSRFRLSAPAPPDLGLLVHERDSKSPSRSNSAVPTARALFPVLRPRSPFCCSGCELLS